MIISWGNHFHQVSQEYDKKMLIFFIGQFLIVSHIYFFRLLYTYSFKVKHYLLWLTAMEPVTLCQNLDMENVMTIQIKWAMILVELLTGIGCPWEDFLMDHLRMQDHLHTFQQECLCVNRPQKWAIKLIWNKNW